MQWLYSLLDAPTDRFNWIARQELNPVDACVCVSPSFWMFSYYVVTYLGLPNEGFCMITYHAYSLQIFELKREVGWYTFILARCYYIKRKIEKDVINNGEAEDINESTYYCSFLCPNIISISNQKVYLWNRWKISSAFTKLRISITPMTKTVLYVVLWTDVTWQMCWSRWSGLTKVMRA